MIVEVKPFNLSEKPMVVQVDCIQNLMKIPNFAGEECFFFAVDGMIVLFFSSKQIECLYLLGFCLDRLM